MLSGSGQSGAIGSRPSGVLGGVSRHEESTWGEPAWGPPWLMQLGCLTERPCTRGAPTEGSKHVGPASQAPRLEALEGRGQLWLSGCPSGVVWCRPWWGQGEGAQMPGHLTPRGLLLAFSLRAAARCCLHVLLPHPSYQSQSQDRVFSWGTSGHPRWAAPPLGIGLLRRLHRKWRM